MRILVGCCTSGTCLATDRSGAETWGVRSTEQSAGTNIAGNERHETLRSGRNRRKKWIYVLLLMGLLGLSGCGSPSSASMDTSAEATSEITQAAETTQEERTELVKQAAWAAICENFTVDYYEDGYKMLTTLPDSQRYLLVPEGQPVPQGLDEDVSILQEPLQNIYLVASGAMDMFASLDAVDQIRFSGQKQENWYIQTAKDAMAAGDMIYAGKYSKTGL